MSNAGAQPVSSATPQAVCVAWSPTGQTIEPRLERALTRPGLEIQHCDDAFGVLGRLAKGVRADGPTRILLLIEPRQLQHLGGVLDLLPRYAPNTAIWLFDPARHPVLRALSIDGAREAAGLAHPPASSKPVSTGSASTTPVVWSGPFVQGGSERSAAPTVSAPGALRLAGEGSVGAAQIEHFARSEGGQSLSTPETKLQDAGECRKQDGSRCRANSRVLTDEEIAMLLGDDPPARKS